MHWKAGVTICAIWGSGPCAWNEDESCGSAENKARKSMSYIPRRMQKNMPREHKDEQVAFLSVGFETTTPAGCLSVKAGKGRWIWLITRILVANKTMPQAYEALKGSADVFLYPGHVNAITGTHLCEDIGRRRHQRCCGRILQQKNC